MTHTPGPWLIAKAQLSSSEIDIIWDRGDGRDDLIACVQKIIGAPQGRTLSNARLIAAAPDLLAAVKSLLMVLADDVRRHDHDPNVAAARMAVDKAEGRGIRP